MSDSLPTHCPDGRVCQFSQKIDDLNQEVDRLSQLVSVDPLTQLFNYRHFSQTLAQEIERSQRTLQATSLIMIDIDHFKKVNDQWGHEKGNQALKLIAKCIIDNIRKLDIACRYGGEEFAIILPSSDIVTSARVAERIRQSIEQTPLTITLEDKSTKKIQLTASAGLSSYNGNNDPDSCNIIEAADEQLYLAKEQGRNRVCYAQIEEVQHQQVSIEEKDALATLFDDRL
jgi:two-component system, cell cycle response regulator